MNAQHGGRVHVLFRVTALWAIALIVLAPTSAVFAQLYPTEDDRAPNPYVGPSFGAAVAISGDTIMVGMPAYDESIGRVGVYTRKSEGWVRTATISNPEPASQGAEFGKDIALEGRSLVVDAHSTAYLFRKPVDRWKLIGAFGRSDPLKTLSSRVAYDFITGFMARSTQTVRINADGGQTDLPGMVRVYRECRSSGAIQRVATLRASDATPTDQFGVSLAMHRGVLVVGAPGLGAAYVFVHDGRRWVQRQKLVSSDGGIGRFGASVDIRNGMIIVGAPEVDVPDDVPDEIEITSPEGKVYTFLPSRGRWFESQRLNDDGQFYLRFGAHVALSLEVAAVVSPANVPASWSRSTVFAFDRIGAHLTGPVGGTSTGNDGARVNDVDASRRRIVAGVLDSPNWGGPWSGWVEIVELDEETAVR